MLVYKGGKNKKEKVTKMERCNFFGKIIASAGYDAQCALLEIKFVKGGRLSRFCDVPEEIWYIFRCAGDPDMYFHKNIKCRFKELK